MPTLKISQNANIDTYANNINARLVIQSMINGDHIVLPAFVTDLSQTFSSNWNTENIYGRNDPIATFQGTTRAISIAVDLPAEDLEIAKHNLKMCSKLAAYMYPAYEQSYIMVRTGSQQAPTQQAHKISEIMSRPPSLKIKLGNLINGKNNEGLLGYIDSLTFNPVTDAGFHIDGQKHYPKVISLSFGFNVLHQQTMGWKQGGAFIGKLPFT